MGVVWAARNELTHREVALKLLSSPNEELRTRLLREARACGSLRHPNIVEIYDVGETDRGEPFLVMELLSGETLADRLARSRTLPPTQAAVIAAAVTRALRTAHAKGIIHRDLKPANVFLHREPDVDIEVVKVLDFGISKSLTGEDAGATTTGMLVGSPAYMSPEQAGGEKGIDQRSDLWTVGVLLFEMIAGARPFPAKAPYAAIGQVLAGPIPRLVDVAPDAPPGLARIVERCLVRDRDARVASADELLRLLRPFSDDLSASHDGLQRVSLDPDMGRAGMLPEAASASPASAVVEVATYPVTPAVLLPGRYGNEASTGDDSDADDERPTTEPRAAQRPIEPAPPAPIAAAAEPPSAPVPPSAVELPSAPVPPSAVELPSAPELSTRTDVLPDMASLPGNTTLPLHVPFAPRFGSPPVATADVTAPLPPMSPVSMETAKLPVEDDMRRTQEKPRVVIPAATASTSTTPLVRSPPPADTAPAPALAPRKRIGMAVLGGGIAALVMTGLLVSRGLSSTMAPPTPGPPSASVDPTPSTSPAPVPLPAPTAQALPAPGDEAPAVSASAGAEPTPEPSASATAQGIADAKTGRAWLEIRSDMPAHAFVDGQPKGLTPIRSVTVAPGPHRVVVRHSLYGEKVVSVTARNGQVEYVYVELEKRASPTKVHNAPYAPKGP